MTVKAKFVFHLKSGKTFECVEELDEGKFLQVVDTIKTSMRDGAEGVVFFIDCCVRLSECAVVEWEVFDE